MLVLLESVLLVFAVTTIVVVPLVPVIGENENQSDAVLAVQFASAVTVTLNVLPAEVRETVEGDTDRAGGGRHSCVIVTEELRVCPLIRRLVALSTNSLYDEAVMVTYVLP